MEQMVYALFEGEESADAAVRALLDDGLDSDVISVLVHHDDVTAQEQDMGGRGTKQRERALLGGALAGTIGAVLGGLVLGPLGLIGAGPLAGLLFGGVGGLYGAVAGAISGADGTPQKLEQLREKLADGKVLVAIETKNTKKTDEIQTILKRYGGQETDVLH